jgi:hypothetical protein
VSHRTVAARVLASVFASVSMRYQHHVIEEKSRHEIITRAKISHAEQKTNMSMRAWIDRELQGTGMPALTDEECGTYALNNRPRLF